MDWIALVAFVAGIILLILGISLVFNLPAIMDFFQKIMGFLCLLLGAVSIFFGYKLMKSV
jgi:hypothetical protein